MLSRVLGRAGCTSSAHDRLRLQYLGAAASGVACCCFVDTCTVQYGPRTHRGVSNIVVHTYTVPTWDRQAGRQAVDPNRCLGGLHVCTSVARSVWLRYAKLTRHAAVDLTAAFFCDDDCRNQASCTLHLTITNSICSLNARGLALPPFPKGICHPVSNLASRGDIVQLPSSGQLSDQQIPTREMEVSAECVHISPPTPTPTPTPSRPLATGRWEPHGEADSLTYCALSRYRPRPGWCL